jgi:hypothetical protein
MSELNERVVKMVVRGQMAYGVASGGESGESSSESLVSEASPLNVEEPLEKELDVLETEERRTALRSTKPANGRSLISDSGGGGTNASAENSCMTTAVRLMSTYAVGVD